MSSTEHTTAYPSGPWVARIIRVGGASKSELLSKLELTGVRLNNAALALFSDERFTTSATGSLIEIVELSVGSLGFRDGATFAQIVDRATEAGLSLCPLELGPHFRLQYTDQPEGSLGQPPSLHRAPPGSITVANAPLADDEETPKGFYLRRIEGALWLRGYRSWPGHIWSPEDILVFSRPTMRPNPSIERTCSSGLRPLPHAAHVKR
jgi:hypothetical protein